MSFGNDVVTFRHLVKTGTFDGQGNAQMTTVDVDAPHCRHRPLTHREVVEAGLDVSTTYWRTTLPLYMYDAPTLAATMAEGIDIIKVNGKNYQIEGGVRPHSDMASVPFKMTIISQRTDAQED